MATIEENIANFIRDAQFRMAEIGVDLDKLDDFDSPQYVELETQQLELYQFMSCLYVGEWNIKDNGYNHLDWDDYDIEQEMEFLRNRTSMITSPFITFVGNYPEIVESITGINLTSGLPSGNLGQYVGYDANGNPIAIDFPVLAGAIDSDTALTYFA